MPMLVWYSRVNSDSIEGASMSGAANPQQVDDFIELFDGDTASAIAAIKDAAKNNKYNAVTTLSPTLTSFTNDEIIISVDSATRTYKIGKQEADALNGISMVVHRGEFIALTGASGSGKSTLLQLIGGLDQPTHGIITVNGVNINQLSDTARSEFRNKTIGFVFQFFYLQPFLTIAKNIEVPGMFAHTSKNDRTQRVQELLRIVGLDGQATYLPKQLSGGQIQRVAIARALLNNPRILLADEPTGNLDSANSKTIIDLFKRIRDELGTTIVIVTHNPDIAAQADHQIHLQDGVIV